MKKKTFYLFLILVFCMITKISYVLADDNIDYFDNLFTNSEFTIYTDAVHNDSESFTNIVNSTIGSYNHTNYLSDNNYINYSLYASSCDYNTKICDITLNKGTFENNNYTSTIVKTYEDITINFDSSVNEYFDMVNDNNISINYDENMFNNESEKDNYILNYISNFGVYDNNSSISYYYNIYSKILYRIESYDSKVLKVISKKINDVIFDYQEDDYSDEFKKLTTGTITIKTDSDITDKILSDYLTNYYSSNYSFSIDGSISNDKVYIKRVNYSNGKTNVLEKHLITLIKDDIDINNFDKIGYGEYIDILADNPLNKNEYITNYLNTVNYSFDYDDTYEYYNELYEYNDDFAIIKYVKRKDGDIINTEYHKALIRFMGYDNTISDNYQNKVGNEIVINADYLNRDTINSNIGYELKSLECNDDYSICDIALYDYENHTIEIHKVNIKLDNSISDEFINAFNIKDNYIDIIKDDEVKINSYGFHYYYYDNDTNNSLEYNCRNDNCSLTLRNYYKNKSETHKVDYNLIIKEPSKDYLSKVKTSIDIYPGETEDIWSRINSSNLFSNNNISNVNVYSCNKNTNKCIVITRNSDKKVELHNSSINIKEGKSPEFNKLFPNDTIKINSVYKDDQNYLSFVSMAYLMSKTKTWSYLSDYNNGIARLNFNSIESHTMNIEFDKDNIEHKKVVDEVIESIGNEKIKIDFDDLEFINYFYYNDNNGIDLVNLNSKKLYDMLSKYINNKHISYFFVDAAGGGGPFEMSIMGEVILYYDGIAYGKLNKPLTANMKNIIYIPDETKDTKEDYIKAAQKRIDNYLGKNSGVIVSFDHVINDGELDKNFMGITEFDGNCYKLSYKNNEDIFIIIKDSSKMQTSTFNAIDVNNNVIVSSEKANYPMNTVVASEKISNSDILKKLGLNEADIIDINLFSPTLGNITEFDGSTFDVSVPIDIERYKGKKLYAYYIDDNGNIEEHEVTIDDFMANFKTDHFSTYIISEKIDNEIILENNPKTGDNIFLYVGILGGCLVAIIAFIIYLKHKKSA